jgi:beta-1,4-mannosyl-glycoprotein beta-1,4-N-acetylglucosaminyltransferase
MRNYLYSFEWLLGVDASWRASVHAYPPPSADSGDVDIEVEYRHSQTSDTALSDAGWHCSFCFRTLAEYAAKMRGYSHADRVGGNAHLLEEAHIQEVVCRGEDVFGMLPEAYNVRVCCVIPAS